MGQKANLIHQYFTLKHQFDILEDSKRPCKEVPSEEDIVFMSREFSVQNLKDKISYVESALEDAKIRINTENYWKDHVADKTNYEAQLDKIHKQTIDLTNDISNKIKLNIQNLLGNRWTCTLHFNFDGAVMEIGIANDNPEYPGYTFKFGHDFDLLFDRKYRFSDGTYEREYELRMNHGCLGSFDLTGEETNKDRIDFLKGMGIFVTNSGLINYIKDKLKFGYEKHKEYREECNKIENILKNPIKYL